MIKIDHDLGGVNAFFKGPSNKKRKNNLWELCHRHKFCLIPPPWSFNKYLPSLLKQSNCARHSTSSSSVKKALPPPPPPQKISPPPPAYVEVVYAILIARSLNVCQGLSIILIVLKIVTSFIIFLIFNSEQSFVLGLIAAGQEDYFGC